jgi:hypothetical protein
VESRRIEWYDGPDSPTASSGPPHALVDGAIGVATGVVVVGLYYLFLRFYVDGLADGTR